MQIYIIFISKTSFAKLYQEKGSHYVERPQWENYVFYNFMLSYWASVLQCKGRQSDIIQWRYTYCIILDYLLQHWDKAI